MSEEKQKSDNRVRRRYLLEASTPIAGAAEVIFAGLNDP